MGRRISQQQELEWQDHFNAQQQSGLSRAKYCRLNNLSVDNFNYHYKKTLGQACTSQSNESESSASEFISLVVDAPSNDARVIELVLQGNEQCITMKVKWTTRELLDFLTGWRAS